MIDKKVLEEIRNLTVRLAQGQEKLDTLNAMAQALSSAPEDEVTLSVFDSSVHVPREFHRRLIDILINIKADQRREIEDLEHALIEIFRQEVPDYIEDDGYDE